MGDVRDLRSAASARRRDAQTLAGELVVQAERSAPRVVRHWVMRTIADAGVGGSSNQVVELLTAELVSNAVVHGPEAGEVRVEVRIDAESVRVGVRDTGGGRPTVGHPEPTAPSGRGLALVEALSSDWGIQTHADGKTVWFEVRTHED
ncbi:ATP-binding protein [uncultured Cellulomonas sp.]|uniref:ATP-binding protein n=1 Tax=uncultured Cellulomonas sp. TaxID=189682 RepID=UPI0028EF9B34|nr:ATP-binding protein [uncultured Cellulomonas sp.]